MQRSHEAETGRILISVAGQPAFFLTPTDFRSRTLSVPVTGGRSHCPSGRYFVVSVFWAPDSFMADPVRDLNNFLQGQPEGNATKDFQWLLTTEGPQHDTIYHVTAVCKYTLCGSPLFFYSLLHNSPGSPCWGWTRPYEGHCETGCICTSVRVFENAW
jgi:hypothetical protein